MIFLDENKVTYQKSDPVFEDFGLGSTLEVVVDKKARLGEGPSWDSVNQCLYWVDIEGKQVHKYDANTKEDVEYLVPDLVGCAAKTESGKLLIGIKKELALLDLLSGHIETLKTIEDGLEYTRINDGKCDVLGNFWFGMMNMESDEPVGGFYRYDKQGRLTKIEAIKATISNGLAWSEEGKRFYYIDTPTRCIRQFECDVEAGRIDSPKKIIEFGEADGWPDGMTIDVDGMLWIAHWGGGRVTRWNPDLGQCIGVIKLPVTNVTCCAFGGVDLNELYITTAREGLSNETLESEPLAGSVFRIKLPVKGHPSVTFTGS